MMEARESIRYGFSLYPFALLIVAGLFISSTGTTLVQSFMTGLQSLPLYSVVVLLVTLLVQATGTVVASAGAFGGLYRVLQDA